MALMSPAVGARMETRRAWRANAWITAVLLVASVIAANRLAKEHLRARIDLSEEQLFAQSPVAERMLGSLADVLSVKAFFTGHVKHGTVQIAKSRLLDQLGEYQDAARGRMDVVFADPNESSEARLEAQRYGIEPVPLRAVQGTAELTQEVFLGLVLRYRGREAVLPFVLPQTFAYGFLSELSGLLRDERRAVGFLSGEGTGAEDDFADARASLAARHRVVELTDLADGAAGDGTQAELDALGLVVVARPRDLHPRAAFALDQYVQRGGNLLILAEHVHLDLAKLDAALIESGLADVLAAWGVEIGRDLVWDESSNYLSISGVGSTQYPFWINVGEDGMERSVPVAGRLPGLDLFWAHPVLDMSEDGSGIERTVLVRSSPSSWLVAPDEALQTGGAALNARGVELQATEAGRPRDLVVALSGAFPSAFAEPGAPAPRDAVADALWKDQRIAALKAGQTPPARPGATTGEPVLTGRKGGAVVVAGDADWISAGKFFTPRNRLFFENVADWLLLEDDLVELRATLPRERKIEDILAAEKAKRGLPTLAGSGALALEGIDPRLLAEAESAATRRRWILMMLATGGALVLATGLALGGRALAGVRYRAGGVS
jgi:ABC-type uncharacterized transport system involved in gliding motility auxiliary subunit